MNKKEVIRMSWLKKLNQTGFDHVMVIVVFVVLFALIGSYLLIKGQAAAWTGSLQLGSDRNLCMNDNNSSKSNGSLIGIYTCGSYTSEKWTISKYSNGQFQLKNGMGICADDWAYGVSTSSKKVYLRTYTCQSNNGSEFWKWNGHELENAYTHGCINDPAYSRTNGTGLIIYPCGGSTGNEQWFEAGLSSSSGGGTSSGGGSTGAPAMPTAAPSGFTRAFSEDFNTAAPLGSFDSKYGSAFGEYTGCCSTNKFTQYSSAKVLYVQNGSMYYKLHSEGSTSYAAAPQPWNEKGFTYGQYGMSVKLDSSTGPGYKIAFLLWPTSGSWSNEVDFPEVDPDFTAPVRAASLNYSPGGGGQNGFSSQDNLNTGVYLTDHKYHTFLLTWTPGKMVAQIDGKTVATFTGSAVPSQPMRLSLQAEGWINQGSIPTSTTDVLEVPYVFINTYK